MTREEAIKILEYIRYTGNDESEYIGREQSIAVDMAIKALEQEPWDDIEKRYEIAKALFDKVVKSEDCISRHSMKMIIFNEIEGFPTDVEISLLKRLMKQVKKLPSVTPQESKKGHWIKLNERYKCSECSLVASESGKLFYNYCPNCGAKMESEVNK